MYNVINLCGSLWINILLQERKKRGENNTQVFLADVYAYQVYLKNMYMCVM